MPFKRKVATVGAGRVEGRRVFQYKERSADDFKRQKEKGSGDFDALFHEGLQMFAAPEGSHHVRFLPPADGEEEHYALEVWIHYGIGFDNRRYWCPAKMDKTGRSRCPICEERGRLMEAGEEEAAKTYRPAKRLISYVIDRKSEADGPKIWNMPFSVDKELLELCFDEDTNTVVFIDHPEEGHDVRFKRVGKGIHDTKYIAFKIDSESSPIHALPKRMDSWLDYIVDHPLSTTLKMYSYEYLSGVVKGGAVPEEYEEEQYGETEEHQEGQETCEAESGDTEVSSGEEGTEYEYVEEPGGESEPEPEPEPEPVRRPVVRKKVVATRANTASQFAGKARARG